MFIKNFFFILLLYYIPKNSINSKNFYMLNKFLQVCFWQNIKQFYFTTHLVYKLQILIWIIKLKYLQTLNKIILVLFFNSINDNVIIQFILKFKYANYILKYIKIELNKIDFRNLFNVKYFINI